MLPSASTSSSASTSAPLLQRPPLLKTPRFADLTRAPSPRDAAAAGSPALSDAALSAPPSPSSASTLQQHLTALVEGSRIVRHLELTLRSALLPKQVSHSYAELEMAGKTARSATLWGCRVPVYNKSLPRRPVALQDTLVVRIVQVRSADKGGKPERLCGVAVLPVQRMRVARATTVRLRLTRADKKGMLRNGLPDCSVELGDEADDSGSGSGSGDSSEEPFVVLEYVLSEQLLLPDECYEPLAALLVASQPRWLLLTLCEELLREVAVAAAAPAVFQVLCATGHLAAYLDAWVAREVAAAADLATLFRADSLGTRVLELLLSHVGAPLLRSALGPEVQRLVREDPSCELSDAKLEPGAVLAEQLAACVRELRALVTTLCAATLAALPAPLCTVLAALATHVARRFPEHVHAPVLAVNAFLFLRFFVPALLAPTQHGVYVGEVPARPAATLNLLARALQKVANQTLFDREREPHLHLLNDTLLELHKDVAQLVARIVERGAGSDASMHAHVSVQAAAAELDAAVRTQKPQPIDVASALSTLLSSVFDAHAAWWTTRLSALGSGQSAEVELLTTLLHTVQTTKDTEHRVSDAYAALTAPTRALASAANFAFAAETLEDELRASPALFAHFDAWLLQRELPERHALHFLVEHAYYTRLPLVLRRTALSTLIAQYLAHEAPHLLPLARDVRALVLARVKEGNARVGTLLEVQRHCARVLAPWLARVLDARRGETLAPLTLKQLLKQLSKQSGHNSPLVLAAPAFFAPHVFVPPMSPKLKKLTAFETWLGAASQRGSVAELCARLVVMERDPALLSHVLHTLASVPEGALTLSAFLDKLFAHALRANDQAAQGEDDAQRLLALTRPDALPTWAWAAACQVWGASWLRTTLHADVSRVLAQALSPSETRLAALTSLQVVDESTRALLVSAASMLLQKLLSSEVPLQLRALATSWFCALRTHFFRVPETELLLVPSAWILHLLKSEIPIISDATPTQVRSLRVVTHACEALLQVDSVILDRRLHHALHDTFAHALAVSARRAITCPVSVVEALLSWTPDADEAKMALTELAHVVLSHSTMLAELTDSKTLAHLQESFGDQVELRKEFTFNQKRMADWTTSDVCDWLDSLGLGEYASQFRDHDVFGKALMSMGSEDLSALGVVKLGHQKRILTQRADFEKGVLSKPPVTSSAVSSTEWSSKDMLNWNLQDVSAWLESIGLDEHVHAFRAASIAGVQLASLQQSDLISLGLVKLGHQKRFLSKRSEFGASVPQLPTTRILTDQQVTYHHRETSQWSLKDVIDWLHAIGLGDHESAFVTAKIDGRRLLELRTSDLEALGVNKLGHQKRILSQRAQFTVQVIIEGSVSSGGSEVSGTPERTRHSSFETKQVRVWSVSEVANWLESLDLHELVDAFVENEITGQKLLELDTAGLQRIGVSKVGHIKKILNRRSSHLPISRRNASSSINLTASAAPNLHSTSIRAYSDSRLSRSAPGLAVDGITAGRPRGAHNRELSVSGSHHREHSGSHNRELSSHHREHNGSPNREHSGHHKRH